MINYESKLALRSAHLDYTHTIQCLHVHRCMLSLQVYTLQGGGGDGFVQVTQN